MSQPGFGSATLAPGSAYRFVTHRTSSTPKNTSYYPNPFFDIAQTYQPQSMQELYKWCRFYSMTNPLISSTIFKISSYPITEVLFETDNEGLRKQYQTLFEDHLKIRSFLVEVNLDRNVYGNAFVTVQFPFDKYLICPSCKSESPARRATYRFRNFEFQVRCKECGFHGPAKAVDRYKKSARGIRLIRWSPENITVRHNHHTGKTHYQLHLSRKVRNDIVLGRKDTVENIPQTYIDAVRKKKAVIFIDGHMFHMKRPAPSMPNDSPLGMSALYPVLKDVFYLQVLKKAQEAIFFGHITPMRVLFPHASSATGDPYSMQNLGNWRDEIAGELLAHKRDANHIPVLPLPVGYQSIGGEGKALGLANEIRIWSEQIVAGMGIPYELAFGGLSWSGSNVSLRMLENEFLGNREDTLSLLRFIITKIARHMSWSTVSIRMKDFKMADDLQRAAFDLQLVQMKLLSKKTMLEQRDYDYDQERKAVDGELHSEFERQRKEDEKMAENQGRAMVIQTKYQIESQKMMDAAGMGAPPEGGLPPEELPPEDPNAQQQQPPAQPAIGEGGIVGASQLPPTETQTQSMQSPVNSGNMAGTGVDMNAAAQMWANRLQQTDPNRQGQILGQLKTQSPELYGLVLKHLGGQQGQGSQPLPEASAPRRGPGTALI